LSCYQFFRRGWLVIELEEGDYEFDEENRCRRCNNRSFGIGVFIATFSRYLQQALLISFFILFPLMFLSGTIVPIESMPASLQHVTYASPVRYCMEISLAIFLKGVGLAFLWPKFLMLLIFGAVIFLLSLGKLRVYG